MKGYGSVTAGGTCVHVNQLPLLNHSEREIFQGAFYVVTECSFIGLYQVRVRKRSKQGDISL